MAELNQDQIDTLLAAVKLLTVLAGAYIVFKGIRAYRKMPEPHLLWLVLGMLVLTIGAVSEGLALQGLGWSTNQSHVFEALVTLAGFMILVYSLVR